MLAGALYACKLTGVAQLRGGTKCGGHLDFGKAEGTSGTACDDMASIPG